MAANVYALLAGIDMYPDPSHRLAGCVGDVAAVAEWLRGRLSPRQLHLETLLDADATRARFIDRVREHLGQARAGDTALLYYAGHGSRERAPVDETLVLWDSRLPGGTTWPTRRSRCCCARCRRRGQAWWW